MSMVDQAIKLITDTVTALLGMFLNLLDATGTATLWIAGISFVFFVSIVLLPFRGGNAIGSDGFVGFLSNKVNPRKESGRFVDFRSNKVNSHRKSWRKPAHDD